MAHKSRGKRTDLKKKKKKKKKNQNFNYKENKFFQ